MVVVNRAKVKRMLKRAALAAGLGTAAAVVACTIAWHASPFPMQQLTNLPESVVITDASGQEMLKVVGRDEQWREPVLLDAAGPWMIAATLAAEDQRYWSHSGLDPVAVARACWQNLTNGRVVSGASTISMQVARMCEPRERTLWAKFVQAGRALQLEQVLDKRTILERYLNMAPYGGNYRGIQAAARHWFAKRACDLTLAEAALMAGLPKSPERLRPDRYLERAVARRNWVLGRMVECGAITQMQCDAAAAETVRLAPDSPRREIPHAAWLALCERAQGGTTTIEPAVQQQLERAIERQMRSMPEGTQLAGVVIDIDRACVVAMVGASDPGDMAQGAVNGVLARRSPGSALKPFIYAAAFEAGRLNPQALVEDRPINRAGWTPENFGHGYAGTVTVAEALQRSLNVPAILVTEGVGTQVATDLLRRCGVSLPQNAAQRAGLGLAVGTVEVSLLDLTNAYATLGRGGLYAPVSLFERSVVVRDRALSAQVAGAISEVLSCRRRVPSGLQGTEQIPWFCWKTGTSSGRRDALAIGHNGRYAVGIWAGAFSGKGRIAYVGAQAAEPVLAEMFTSSVCAAAGDPPSPPAIAITNPLAPPAERAQAMRILSPANGSVFIATSAEEGAGPVAVVVASGSRDGTWFLNGRRIEDATRLCCQVGAYELRCVAADGSSHSVKFKVSSGAAQRLGLRAVR
ncbi:MAG: penicillin-binding protein 1C [Planctomycetota bacterium]|nr:penicillin-binding protein 1C [Planctomycetota bacterium]